MLRTRNRFRGKVSLGAALPPTVSSFFDVWLDPTIPGSITGSPVAEIRRPNYAGAFTTPPRAIQTAAANRPAITANRLVFDGTNDMLDGSEGYTFVSRTTLPDNRYSETGKGFTITGLARYSDGRFAAVSYGKKNESTAGSETADGGIHTLNAARDTILSSIYFADAPLSLANVGAQGVAVDESTGIIYVNDLTNGRIYGINPVGPSLTYNFAFAGANALAYDSINGELLVQTVGNRNLTRVNKTTGATIATITYAFSDDNFNDHLCYDPSGPFLWGTSRGGNGVAGMLVKYAYTQVSQTMVPLRSWQFAESEGIEGVVVVGNTAILADDAHYHNVLSDVNSTIAVTLDPSSDDYGTTLIIAGVMHVNATPGTVTVAHAGGDPIGKKGAGIYWTNVANRIRLFVRAGGAAAIVDWDGADTLNPAIRYFLIDTVAGTASLYQNGTLVSTQANANLVGSIPRFMWTHGACYEATPAGPTRWSTLRSGGFIVSTRNDRAEIEGYLAHATGNTALLPGGHLYKTNPPVIT